MDMEPGRSQAWGRQRGESVGEKEEPETGRDWETGVHFGCPFHGEVSPHLQITRLPCSVLDLTSFFCQGQGFQASVAWGLSTGIPRDQHLWEVSIDS